MRAAEWVADVRGDRQLDAAQPLTLLAEVGTGAREVGAECLERAAATVTGRAAPDRHDHLPSACLHGGRDQLAGSARRGGDRIVLARFEAPEPRCLRHLDDRGPVEEPERRRYAAPERV